MSETTPSTCPICGQVLTDDDQLVARYYAPRKWRVVAHVIAKPNSIAEFNHDSAQKMLIDNASIYCHEAGFSLTK